MKKVNLKFYYIILVIGFRFLWIHLFLKLLFHFLFFMFIFFQDVAAKAMINAIHSFSQQKPTSCIKSLTFIVPDIAQDTIKVSSVMFMLYMSVWLSVCLIVYCISFGICLSVFLYFLQSFCLYYSLSVCLMSLFPPLFLCIF